MKYQKFGPDQERQTCRMRDPASARLTDSDNGNAVGGAGDNAGPCLQGAVKRGLHSAFEVIEVGLVSYIDAAIPSRA